MTKPTRDECFNHLQRQLDSFIRENNDKLAEAVDLTDAEHDEFIRWARAHNEQERSRVLDDIRKFLDDAFPPTTH